MLVAKQVVQGCKGMCKVAEVCTSGVRLWVHVLIHVCKALSMFIDINM